MKMNVYKVEEIGHGHSCFRKAVENGDVLAVDSGNDYGCFDDGIVISMCDVITKLIQITGRFCEFFASDVVWEIAKINAFEEFKANGEENHWVIPIGIRSHGVDHEEFILERLAETEKNGYVYPEHVYRKLLAVDINDSVETWENGDKVCVRIVILVDITHSLYKID